MFQFEHKLLNESICEHSVWSTLFWHTHTEYSLSMEYVLSALHAIQYNTIQYKTLIYKTLTVSVNITMHNTVTAMYDTQSHTHQSPKIFLNPNFRSCY